MPEKLEVRSIAYTRQGRKVHIDAITTDGDYVVSGMNAAVWGEEVYEERGETWIERDLTATPPVEIFDEDIKARTEKIAELRNKHSELTASVANAEKEVKDRLAKLQKFNGLENLEAFIDGRVTHVVIDGWSEIKVMGIDALDYTETDSWSHGRLSKGIKLVVLFGNSKGDLTWNVNQYKDGSGGSWQRIQPCMSQAEGEEIRRQWALERLEGYRSNIDGAHKRHDLIAAAVKRCEEYGAAVPEDFKVIADAFVEEAKAKQLAAIEAEIEKHRQKLSELSA